jgi:subtilase family serine protease
MVALGITLLASPSGAPLGRVRVAEPMAQSAYSSPTPIGYTPAEILRAYGLDSVDDRTGLGRRIAIVVAFHQPQLEHDLERFISTFGLPPIAGIEADKACDFVKGPHPCFHRAHLENALGVNPKWALETAEDVEWAHAISPMADLLLVEAQSDRVEDLLSSVDVAVSWRADVVEMSWGTTETSLQLIDDRHFAASDIAFVAATGDAPGMVGYPAASPYVIAVGGTSLRLDRQGRRTSETAWSQAGGGVSRFEPQPTFQTQYSAPFSHRMRTVPDVAANADFDNAYAVTTADGFNHQPSWYRGAGSSGAAVVWAALLSLASSDCAWRVDVEPYVAHLYQDVTIGQSSWRYDLQTGLGPPDAHLLLPKLCAPDGGPRHA